jgi:hypothetical protein
MIFHRPELAQQLLSALQGKLAFSDAQNGLFLAAPRRTGKSTFLMQDLVPALKSAGVAVVYVDLWADKRRDPGSLIADAIGRELADHLGIVAKTAKAVGLDKVTVAGALQIDTSKIGKADGLTLADALKNLTKISKKPVALIIDEAQHALTSTEGEAAMTALKSARDQMNVPGSAQLMLVMSGSDRDKLLRLVNSSAAAFYGSRVEKMPALDEGFIAEIAQRVEKQYPILKPVDVRSLYESFQTFGSRPQLFLNALGDALNPAYERKERFEQTIANAAEEQLELDELQMESDYLALKRIEQVVLWRMLEQGSKFRPYDAEAHKFYSSKLSRPVSTQQIQAAIESLRERNPPLVWKSARSEYVVEDASMHRWYEKRVAADTWPPNDPQGLLVLDSDAS